jgi:glycosyltransferase involved in cell wall biosynthesis
MTQLKVFRSVSHTDQDSRPTVCHVIHALGVGGAEVLVNQMVRELASDFRCIVAVLDEVGEIGAQLRSDGFLVEHLHRGEGIDRACARRLNDLVRRENVSLLHAHQYTPFFQAMLSRGFFGSTPVLFTEHGRHVPDLPSWKRTIVNRLLLRSHDRMVGCGGSVQQALIDNEGLPRHRVELVYNGVDLDDLASAPPGARQRIRSEFGFSNEDFVAVQVARLHELKDHQTALRTIAHARHNFPRIRLLVVGEGEERPAIEHTIDELNLHQHVVLAGSRSDVSHLLAASDAFLLTSISEGIPLTVIEAMAAELPIVSTAVGGLPEMIEDGVSGYLCDARDHEALANRLTQLDSNPEERQQMAIAGKVTACSRFSLEHMLNTYSNIYSEMIPEHAN